MVKSYLRYVPESEFGLISSSNCNVAIDLHGKIAYVGADSGCVSIWNIRRNTRVGMLAAESSTFTSSGGLTNLEAVFIRNYRDKKLSVGYNDGSIRVFSLGRMTFSESGSGDFRLDESVVYRGHNSSISFLEFSEDGNLLASGSREGNIVVWDLMHETGLSRLKGHSDAITGISFLSKAQLSKLIPENSAVLDNEALYLISSSKDKLVKVWDVRDNFCQQTLVDHGYEITGFIIALNENLLISSAYNSQFHLFKFIEDVKLGFRLVHLGNADRGPSGVCRAVEIHWLPNIQSPLMHPGGYICVTSNEKNITVYKLLSEEEQKKAQLKQKKQNPDHSDNNKPPHIIRQLGIISCNLKVKSAAINFSNTNNNILKVFLTTIGNTIELYELNSTTKQVEPQLIYSIDQQGHRSGIKQVVISYENDMLATCSNEALKVWNATSRACIRSFFPKDFSPILNFTPVTLLFSSKDKYIITGAKEGHIAVLDLASGDCLHLVENAHKNTLWALVSKSDISGDYISGGSDKMVHFWHLSDTDGKFILTQSMQVSDDVLALAVSPDRKYFCASLLDCTVKVFFLDTLKFYLSLYGHKLPVLSVDFSLDGTLIATGSADKNIKIWGCDFGDCHKSIFAHNEAVTCVRFLPKTHYVMSAGRDRLIKYWDADKFVLIAKMTGHIGEVSSLSVSRNGGYLISSSSDRTVRVWKRSTDDLIFLEEEREREADEALDASLPTAASELTAVEVLSDKLDALQPGQILPFEATISSQILMLLPVRYVIVLLEQITHWIKSEALVPAVAKLAIAILRIHGQDLSTHQTSAVKSFLSSIKESGHTSLQHHRDLIGLNISRLKSLAIELDHSIVQFDMDENIERSSSKRILHF